MFFLLDSIQKWIQDQLKRTIHKKGCWGLTISFKRKLVWIYWNPKVLPISNLLKSWPFHFKFSFKRSENLKGVYFLLLTSISSRWKAGYQKTYLDKLSRNKDTFIQLSPKRICFQ
jgi:hypothetical protein